MRTPRWTPGAEPSPPPPVRGRRAHAGPAADEDQDEPAGGATGGAAAPESRWRIRPRTVRAKIVCLLMVPVVSLLALWSYATVTTAQDIARLRQVQRVDAQIRTPLATTVAALQAERTAAVRCTTVPAAGQCGTYKKLAGRTDKALAKLRLGNHHTVADSEELPAAVNRRLEAFVEGAEGLRSLRASVLDRRAAWETTYAQYTHTIGGAFGVDGALTGIQDAGLGSDVRVLLELSRAGEALAQEDAVLAGVRPADALSGERLRLFTGAVATRRALTDAAATDLRGPQRDAWHTLAGSSSYAALTTAEDAAVDGTPGPLTTAPETTWTDAHARVQHGMQTIQGDAARGMVDRAAPFRRALLTPAGAAVLFGLLAIITSFVISVRIGRGLVVELVSLRDSALEIARRSLPDAMRRLRAGEEIDVQAEAPPGRPTEDEAGQVAEALGTVHRAALRAAVERAELASGISGVFVNLARRSQVLVHRQLNLLDSMERRSDDPNELGDLFRLDHLTTRMRRHAESLIILSGAAPGRAWRMPVPLTNVVRAAVSEVEDYARVEVRQFPVASVVGAAVADLTHLLAELIENAAQFSPPHTRVRVIGEPVGNGYVIEVEDRGLGMGTQTLAEANRRIEQSEALDLFDSDRLGLFVVSKLAARQGIKVHLRTSPYGGTTAVVLIPTALLHEGTAERSPDQASDAPPAVARAYARTPDAATHQESVPATAERPALVAHLPAAAETTSDPQPPGVTTLRLHRPPEDREESEDLPRRVRQANLAPQLRARHTEEPMRTSAGPASPREDRRTPEDVRERIAAYRDGWRRGGGRQPGRGAGPDPTPRRDSSEGDRA
ncbi:nitrate- and nitrite sensing domain-containing protein [Streptomyces sp. NPDC048419]|uniref:sensor histidine kinase n=1 Tax=Streptomyces sp. NPDC048419 TaxID=3365547 RepID=UPI00371525F5